MEIELKLAVDRKDLSALMDHPALADLITAPEERLRATYFDTADHALRAHGAALRVRREGRAWVQCFKGAGSYAGGLHRRDEHEALVEKAKVDASKLPIEGPWGELLRSKLDHRHLEPLFTTDVHRKRMIVHGENGAEIEVALDQGAVRCGRKRRQLCELELELRAGDPVEIFRLARSFLERVPLRVEPLNKAEHGYQLRAAEIVESSKAIAPNLEPTEDLRSAVKTSLAECARHFHANEAAVIVGDMEGVHQMRVALRRLRAALNAFKPYLDGDALMRFRTEVGWLNEVLGPIRDWDVFLEGIQPLRKLRTKDGGLQRVFASGRARRESHHGELLNRMGDPRYTRFQLSLGEAVVAPPFNDDAPLSNPIGPIATGVVRKLRRRMLRDGEHFDRLAPEARHELRIRAKKLRYALQFFNRLYDGRAKSMLSALGKVQDSLGALNDLTVADSLLDEAGVSAKSPTRALIDGWTLAHGDYQSRQAQAAWEEFLRAPRPWKRKG